MNLSFDYLYHKYYDEIYKYIYSYTLNKYDTEDEDIIQKNFLKLYNNISKLKN